MMFVPYFDCSYCAATCTREDRTRAHRQPRAGFQSLGSEDVHPQLVPFARTRDLEPLTIAPETSRSDVHVAVTSWSFRGDVLHPHVANRRRRLVRVEERRVFVVERTGKVSKASAGAVRRCGAALAVSISSLSAT